VNFNGSQSDSAIIKEISTRLGARVLVEWDQARGFTVSVREARTLEFLRVPTRAGSSPDTSVVFSGRKLDTALRALRAHLLEHGKAS
jgi:hypothetical protein